MSMLKKTAALTVSAVLLLQPMTASAVTWSNIVDGLRNSGSNRYTEDGTTIEKDGDNYTVTGGTIEDGVYVTWDRFDGDDSANFILKNLVVKSGAQIDTRDGKKVTLIIDKDTLVKGNMWAHAEGKGSSAIIINDGNAKDVWAYTYDGAYASVTNNGITEGLHGNSYDEGSKSEVINGQNGQTKDIWIWTVERDGSVYAENNGTVSNQVWLGAGGFAEGQTGTADFVNNGEMKYLQVAFNGNAYDVKNDGTVTDSTLEVDVKQGTSVEEILQMTQGMIDADRIRVNEYAQDIYDDWKLVNQYYIENSENPEDPEQPENPDEPENPNEPENPEQPEATQQPTFEVSKYDQERHEMEEKRKEEAIGGVYGSPYWVKQLYLGYHSLNLRLFVGEQQSNFKQSLSWMPDSTKQLTLRVNTDAPEKLTMRLDEKALETLERTEFSVITLLDKSGNAVMQYSLSDLRSVYDQYGLSGDDQMVVGGANDDVMKIVNGEMKPIEA